MSRLLNFVFPRFLKSHLCVSKCVALFISIFLSTLVVSSCSKSSKIHVDLVAVPGKVHRGDTVIVTLQSNRELGDGNTVVKVAPQDGIGYANVQKTGPRTVTFAMVAEKRAPLGKRIVSLKLGNIVGDCELVVEEALAQVDTETVAAMPFDTDVPTEAETETESAKNNTLPQPSVDLRPNSLFTGQTKSLSLFGVNTHFSSSSTVFFPAGSGLVVEKTDYLGMTISDGEQLSLSVRADKLASVGNIIGTVQSPTDAGVETVYFSIKVIAAPTLTLTPSVGVVGENSSITLLGNGTHFQADAPATLVLVAPASRGVSINLDGISSATKMAATVYVSENAVPGEYEISASTFVKGEEERVTAIFTLKPDSVDTDTGDVENKDTGKGDACADFEIIPASVTIGSFNKTIRFEAPAEMNWGKDSAVLLSGENSHFHMDSSTGDAADKCFVNTSRDIACKLTAGLAATPGEYEIHVESGGITTCARLTVTADEVGHIEIPTNGLPEYNMYPGALDAEFNASDFYAFEVTAGTTAIFHAYSLNRTTMDPVLRLIDGAGDEWIASEDDETRAGIDARLVYHFAESGDYHLEVGPKLSNNDGAYQLYTYLLTHGNVTPETENDNDTFETAQVIDAPLCAVVHAAADFSDDVDYYYFETDGPVMIHVVGRKLGKIDDVFADTRITLYDDEQMELDASSAWYEISDFSNADPRLFVADAGSYYLKVETEQETSGFYALNIRPYLVINEISNTANNNTPWIELQGAYNADLSEYELCTFDEFGESIDIDAPCVNLAGFFTDADGYVAIYADDFLDATLMLPQGPGAVSLLYQGSVMDQVQFGTVGNNALAEEAPADVGTYRVIGRAAGVDSNNNKLDFVYMASPSPGMPNDRTFQSAIPLYGEPVD